MPPAFATAEPAAVRVPRMALRGVHLRHPGGERDVVRDLHLELHAGEILCLVGPNGSGKSTTLAALGRELRPPAFSDRARREAQLRLRTGQVLRQPFTQERFEARHA